MPFREFWRSMPRAANCRPFRRPRRRRRRSWKPALRISEAVAQEQQPATEPGIGQLSPMGMARRERLAHHEAQASVADLSARELRRERQELLIEKMLLIELAKQSRAAFDEDALGRHHPMDLVENMR